MQVQSRSPDIQPPTSSPTKANEHLRYRQFVEAARREASCYHPRGLRPGSIFARIKGSKDLKTPRGIWKCLERVR